MDYYHDSFMSSNINTYSNDPDLTRSLSHADSVNIWDEAGGDTLSYGSPSQSFDSSHIVEQIRHDADFLFACLRRQEFALFEQYLGIYFDLYPSDTYILNRPHPDADYTLLMWGVQNNDTAIVDLILSFGADVDAMNNEGITALFIAVEDHLYDLARHLVTMHRAQANSMFIDKHGNDMLMATLISANVKLEQLGYHADDSGDTCRDGHSEDALQTAAELNAIETVSILLQYGSFDLSLVNHKGQCAKDLVGHTITDITAMLNRYNKSQQTTRAEVASDLENLRMQVKQLFTLISQCKFTRAKSYLKKIFHLLDENHVNLQSARVKKIMNMAITPHVYFIPYPALESPSMLTTTTGAMHRVLSASSPRQPLSTVGAKFTAGGHATESFRFSHQQRQQRPQGECHNGGKPYETAISPEDDVIGSPGPSLIQPPTYMDPENPGGGLQSPPYAPLDSTDDFKDSYKDYKHSRPGGDEQSGNAGKPILHSLHSGSSSSHMDHTHNNYRTVFTTHQVDGKTVVSSSSALSSSLSLTTATYSHNTTSAIPEAPSIASTPAHSSDGHKHGDHRSKPGQYHSAGAQSQTPQHSQEDHHQHKNIYGRASSNTPTPLKNQQKQPAYDIPSILLTPDAAGMPFVSAPAALFDSTMLVPLSLLSCCLQFGGDLELIDLLLHAGVSPINRSYHTNTASSPLSALNSSTTGTTHNNNNLYAHENEIVLPTPSFASFQSNASLLSLQILNNPSAGSINYTSFHSSSGLNALTQQQQQQQQQQHDDVTRHPYDNLDESRRHQITYKPNASGNHAVSHHHHHHHHHQHATPSQPLIYPYHKMVPPPPVEQLNPLSFYNILTEALQYRRYHALYHILTQYSDSDEVQQAVDMKLMQHDNIGIIQALVYHYIYNGDRVFTLEVLTLFLTLITQRYHFDAVTPFSRRSLLMKLIEDDCVDFYFVKKCITENKFTNTTTPSVVNSDGSVDHRGGNHRHQHQAYPATPVSRVITSYSHVHQPNQHLLPVDPYRSASQQPLALKQQQIQRRIDVLRLLLDSQRHPIFLRKIALLSHSDFNGFTAFDYVSSKHNNRALFCLVTQAYIKNEALYLVNRFGESLYDVSCWLNDATKAYLVKYNAAHCIDPLDIVIDNSLVDITVTIAPRKTIRYEDILLASSMRVSPLYNMLVGGSIGATGHNPHILTLSGYQSSTATDEHSGRVMTTYNLTTAKDNGSSAGADPLLKYSADLSSGINLSQGQISAAHNSTSTGSGSSGTLVSGTGSSSSSSSSSSTTQLGTNTAGVVIQPIATTTAPTTANVGQQIDTTKQSSAGSTSLDVTSTGMTPVLAPTGASSVLDGTTTALSPGTQHPGSTLGGTPVISPYLTQRTTLIYRVLFQKINDRSIDYETINSCRHVHNVLLPFIFRFNNQDFCKLNLTQLSLSIDHQFHNINRFTHHTLTLSTQLTCNDIIEAIHDNFVSIRAQIESSYHTLRLYFDYRSDFIDVENKVTYASVFEYMMLLHHLDIEQRLQCFERFVSLIHHRSLSNTPTLSNTTLGQNDASIASYLSISSMSGLTPRRNASDTDDHRTTAAGSKPTTTQAVLQSDDESNKDDDDDDDDDTGDDDTGALHSHVVRTAAGGQSTSTHQQRTRWRQRQNVSSVHHISDEDSDDEDSNDQHHPSSPTQKRMHHQQAAGSGYHDDDSDDDDDDDDDSQDTNGKSRHIHGGKTHHASHRTKATTSSAAGAGSKKGSRISSQMQGSRTQQSHQHQHHRQRVSLGHSTKQHRQGHHSKPGATTSTTTASTHTASSSTPMPSVHPASTVTSSSMMAAANLKLLKPPVSDSSGQETDASFPFLSRYRTLYDPRFHDDLFDSESYISGLVERLRQYLNNRHFATEVNKIDSTTSLSPLIVTTKEFDLEGMEALLLLGADVHYRAPTNGSHTNRSRTALLFAATNSSDFRTINVLKVLLRYGASLLDVDVANSTIYHYCFYLHDVKPILPVYLFIHSLVPQLINQYNDVRGYTPLMWLSGKPNLDNSYEVMEALLENKADVNAICGYNNQDDSLTSLMKMVKYSNNRRSVELLLQYGADTKIKTKNNQTALDFSVDSYKKLLQ